MYGRPAGYVSGLMGACATGTPLRFARFFPTQRRTRMGGIACAPLRRRPAPTNYEVQALAITGIETRAPHIGVRAELGLEFGGGIIEALHCLN